MGGGGGLEVGLGLGLGLGGGEGLLAGCAEGRVRAVEGVAGDDVEVCLFGGVISEGEGE